MGTHVTFSVFLFALLGLSWEQQFVSRGQQSLSGVSGGFPTRFRVSSGSSQRGAFSPWSGISSTGTSGTSPFMQTGSASSSLPSVPQGARLVLSDGTVLRTGSSNNNIRLQQAPRQTTLTHSLQQPQQVQILHAAQPTSRQQGLTAQPRQVLSAPQQVLTSQTQHVVAAQPRQVVSAPRQIITAPQQVLSAPQQTITAQQPVAQPVQTAQTALPSAAQLPVTQPRAALPAMSGMAAMPGMHGMHGMMPGMSPMSAMMGGMGMGMGMPFMTYDTMEDLFLDPDRPSHFGPPMGAAPAMAARAAAAAAAPVPAVPASAPSAVVGTAAQASAASVGLGHLAAPVASTVDVQQATSARAGGATGQVNPAIVQSALQTALSRVQQRQAQPATVIG